VATLIKSFPINYGGETRFLEVPEENLEAVAKIKDLPPLLNLKEAVKRAVENPIGGEKLSDLVKPGCTVAVLTIDRLPITTSIMNPIILDVLNEMGVKDQDITLVYAVGTHQTPANEAHLGLGVAERVKVVRHLCDDEKVMEYVGITRFGTPLWINRHVLNADVKIGLSEVAPHPVAGYMGGSKIILPGVAARDSIDHNHSFLLSPKIFYGVVDGNIIREDMNEAARMAGLDMKIDVLINSKQEIVNIFAGDPIKEWRAAIPFSDQIWSTRIKRRADIFIYHPGSMRESMALGSLYQSAETAELCLKDDGIIINASSCTDGVAGKPSPPSGARGQYVPPLSSATKLARLDTDDLARLIVRHKVNVRDAVLVYRQRGLLEKYRFFLASTKIPEDEAREYGFEHSGLPLKETVNKALQEKGKGARVVVMLQEGIAWRNMVFSD